MVASLNPMARRVGGVPPPPPGPPPEVGDEADVTSAFEAGNMQHENMLMANIQRDQEVGGWSMLPGCWSPRYMMVFKPADGLETEEDHQALLLCNMFHILCSRA